MVATKTYQGRERDLGRIRRPGKHGLPKDCLTLRYAIQPAYQFAVHPGFHTVRLARSVQLAVGCDHRRKNPAARLITACCVRTCADHVRERGIEADLASRVACEACQGFAQRPVQSEVGDLQNHARVGAPPQIGLSLAEPREDSLVIGFLQARDRQIAARRQQTRGVRPRPPGRFDWWKRAAGL